MWGNPTCFLHLRAPRNSQPIILTLAIRMREDTKGEGERGIKRRRRKRRRRRRERARLLEERIMTKVNYYILCRKKEKKHEQPHCPCYCKF